MKYHSIQWTCPMKYPPRHGCIPLQMFNFISVFQTYDPYIRKYNIIYYGYIMGSHMGIWYMFLSSWLYPHYHYLPLEQSSKLSLIPCTDGWLLRWYGARYTVVCPLRFFPEAKCSSYWASLLEYQQISVLSAAHLSSVKNQGLLSLLTEIVLYISVNTTNMALVYPNITQLRTGSTAL